MSAVKIGVQPNRSGLGFDLADVLTAVGAHPNLDWVLRESQIVWPGDVVPDEFTFDRPDNPLTWEAMQRLAAAVLQVVDISP